MPKASTHQKELFLRLCRHYVVAAPGSPTMTKAFFEAHLIGLALQARLTEPGPSLGNGQWAKELLTELLPTFTWSSAKSAATKATTNAIAFVNVPVLRDDGTPEAEQHRFILDFLHVDSSTLTHGEVDRIRHLGSHHLDAMRLRKDEVRPNYKAPARGLPGAGGPSSSTSLAVASPLLLTVAGGSRPAGAVGADAIPPGVRHMASLIEVDTEPQRPGERSWLAPFGGPVAAFFVFGGPPEVTEYTWHTKNTRVDAFLLEHRPALIRQSANTCTVGHSFLDTFHPGQFYTPCSKGLSKSGRTCGDTSCKRCSKQLYKRVLFCKGGSHRAAAAGTDPAGPHPNCRRECGGVGVCAAHCRGLANMSPAVAKLHCCAARIVIEISGALLSRGKMRITLLGGAHYTNEPGLMAQTARAGCLPCELQKHHATLLRQLASRACQQEFDTQQAIMRESAFQERLFMVLSIGDKRLRNYLLPCLGDRAAPVPAAASETPPAVLALLSTAGGPPERFCAPGTVFTVSSQWQAEAAADSANASVALLAAAAADAWYWAGTQGVLAPGTQGVLALQ